METITASPLLPTSKKYLLLSLTAGTADIQSYSTKKVNLTEHKEVGCVAVHILLVQTAVEHLDVATSAVDVLFMFNGELDYQRLVFIAEWLEFAGNCIKPRIFRCLDT